MENKIIGENFSPLGLLDKQEKNIIWNTTISGSQIRKLFYNIKELYNDKKTQNINSINSVIVEEKMKRGIALEPLIREMAKKEFDLDIKYDPTTFAQVNQPFCTANIDGYIEHEDTTLDIVEIKNTTEMDIEKSYEYYKYQIQYYIWFFRANGAYLITLANGWKLQKKYIEPDMELIQQILDRILALYEALKNNKFDNKIFNENNDNNIKDSEVVYLESIAEQNLNRLGDLKKTIETLEEEADILEKELKDNFAKEDKTVTLATNNYSYKLTTSVRKGNIKYKDLLKDKNISDEEAEKYRGENTIIVKGVLTSL